MTDETMSPPRTRMIEGMTIRKFVPKSQHDYVQRHQHRQQASKRDDQLLP